MDGGQLKGQMASPRLLGVHLCELCLALAMLLTIVFGFLCSPSQFNYDLGMLRVLLLMAGGSASLWLISQRANSSRFICAFTVIGCAVLSAVDRAAFGAYDTLASYIGHGATIAIIVVEYASAIAIALYLLLSPQARRVLSNPPDMEPGSPDRHGWDKPLRQRIKRKAFWRDLLIYFIVFSIVGHWAEMLFCQLILAGVFMGGYDASNAMLWSQWLFPFTAEGAALVAIVLLLHPASRWLLKKTGNRVVLAVVLSFLLNMAVCTAIDFTTGMVANQNFELWDYRDMPFNFMGQVCLQNSLVYSVVATLIVWVVYPAMDAALHRAPRGVTNAVAFGLIGMYLFLAALYFVDPAAFPF